MNTTGGIFVLLSIVLFIFSSFDVEAKVTARSAKEVARRIIEKDPDLAQKEAELIFKLEAVREYLSDLDPTLNKNFDPMKAVHEINKNFISIESIQAREVPTASEISNINVNTYLLARQKTSPVFISSERASSIVEVLSYKLGEGKVSETTKKNLTEAIQLRNSIIGPSLLKLAQKVESARTEDVEVIVKFAENIKDIQPTAKNERNPEVANILLDLGQNLHDMPFWDAQPRTTVMSVLKTFNEKLNKKATKEDTEILLQVPGPPALNSPNSKVATSLRVNDTIIAEVAFKLAIIKNMVRMEDISAYGLQTAIRMIKQRIRELCKG